MSYYSIPNPDDNMPSECRIVNKNDSETSYTCTNTDEDNNHKRALKYTILNKNHDLLINWKPYFDNKAKSWYWFNSKTREARWNKPNGFLNVEGLIIGGMSKSNKSRKYRRSKKSKKLHSLNRSYKLSNQRRRIYRRRVSK